LIGCMGVGLVARRIWRHGRAGRSLSLSSFREAPTIRTIQTIHRGNGLRPDGQDDISIISYNILADQVGDLFLLLEIGSLSRKQIIHPRDDVLIDIPVCHSLQQTTGSCNTSIQITLNGLTDDRC